MPDASDIDLLRDYEHHGSEAAFTAIIQRHVNLVYSVALRHVGMPAHAEEITQAVFIVLARKAAGLRLDTILEGWLHETTRLTALSFLRGERRRQFREQEAYMQSTLPESNADAAWNQLAPLLDEALSRLGKNDRDAVMLRYFKEKSVREVAVAMNVNEPAAQRRILRAVEKLRAFFAKRGIALSTAALTTAISANSIQAAPAGLAAAATIAALSGTTITTTAIVAVTKTIAMTTLQKSLVTVTVAVLAGAGIYESRQAAQLRDQVQTLQQQQAPLVEKIQELTGERDEMTRQLAVLREDNKHFEQDKLELLRLRAEAGHLRRQKSDLEAQLHQNPQNLVAAGESNGTAKVAFGSELRDMGASTPERAAGSLIWAASSGKQARVAELLELPKSVTEEDAPKHYEFFTKQLSNTFSGMEFTSVESIKENSDGTLKLRLTYRDINTEKNLPFPFMLRLHDSGWKVVVEGEVPKILPASSP